MWWSEVRWAGILVLLALVLAGCGFHLRGTQTLDEALVVVAVRDVGKSGQGRKTTGNATWYGGERDELRRVVAQALTDSGATVTDEAPLVIELLGEEVKRRTAAIGVSANVAEYQLDYLLRYRVVTADNSVLIPETQIERDRTYRYDERSPMGSAEEEALLRREMRRTAARQLATQYRRLSTPVAVPAAVESHESTAP